MKCENEIQVKYNWPLTKYNVLDVVRRGSGQRVGRVIERSEVQAPSEPALACRRLLEHETLST